MRVDLVPFHAAAEQSYPIDIDPFAECQGSMECIATRAREHRVNGRLARVDAVEECKARPAALKLD